MNKPTPHDIEILMLSARLGVKGAAKELSLSEQTIKNTLLHVYRKIEARSMAHAVLLLTAAPAEGLHHHDINGVALWFDGAGGKPVGGPADD